MSVVWNPWHGCHKISSGCQNCYVYRTDAKYGKDSYQVEKTNNFTLPIKKMRNKDYKIPSGEIVYTCFTSDFFLDDADKWRDDAWKMIAQRKDLQFLIITKRIDRFTVRLPKDWCDGYDHVAIGCTVENQDRCNYRLPIFLSLPIKHRFIICEPLLSKISLSPYLGQGIEKVIVGGESGNDARLCDFDWVLDIRRQCIDANVDFSFKQTGAFFKKDGRVYRVLRKYQHSQARKANIEFKKL